jgi:hypothetical protein
LRGRERESSGRVPRAAAPSFLSVKVSVFRFRWGWALACSAWAGFEREESVQGEVLELGLGREEVQWLGLSLPHGSAMKRKRHVLHARFLEGEGEKRER